MNGIRNLSFLRKLTLSSMLSTLFAVIAVIIIIGVLSFNLVRQEIVKNIQTTANIVGTSTRSAITSNNPQLAYEFLSNLKNQPDVISAKIFLPGQDAPFIEFHNQSYTSESDAHNIRFTKGSIVPIIRDHQVVISEPVFQDNEIIASIFIRASLRESVEKAKFFGILSFVAFILAVLISQFIWRMTRSIWAGPFLRLSRTIRTITVEQDYSKRLRVDSTDEMGELISGFNAMLEQIEKQRFQLLSQQVDLEQEVDARTQELTRANRKLISEVAERSKSDINIMKLSSAITQAEEAVLITDSDGLIEYINPSFEIITGFRETDVIGKKPSILKSDEHDISFYANMWKTLSQGLVFKGVFINKRPNGEIYHLEQSITPIRNEYGKFTNYVATGRDISERIKVQEELHHIAHHDGLTGLPNRSLLTDRIDHAIKRASREKSEIAVMFIDLDGFKLANDIYGHEAGDIVLKEVAKRLLSVIRSQDTVARISGDEFAVVLEDMNSVADAGMVARKIMEAISEPCLVKDNEIFVTASIGIAVFPLDGIDTSKLLKRSDQAMYNAKRNGKARYSFYSENDNALDTKRMETEHLLIRAVKDKQFILHYQPLMRTDEKKVYGVEALIRWKHPRDGIVMPDNFIPSLEDSGMINEVGAWVMEEACRQLAEWNAKGTKDLTMSVNVSPRQLNDNQFINHLNNALQTSGINPCDLVLEITERIFLEFNDINIRTLNRVADLGVRIAVDDFGMGHSSLTYISNLPISTLKIDRSFINKLTNDKHDERIVSALIGLAERLDISVTAEGVETREQLKILDQLNCEFAQGYLWAKAMSPQEFESWSIGATQKMRILTAS